LILLDYQALASNGLSTRVLSGPYPFLHHAKFRVVILQLSNLLGCQPIRIGECRDGIHNLVLGQFFIFLSRFGRMLASAEVVSVPMFLTSPEFDVEVVIRERF
jgi:hypothetical protein